MGQSNMLKVKRKYVSLDNCARKNVFKMGLSCRFSSNYWSQPTIGQIQLLVRSNYWSDPTIGQIQWAWRMKECYYLC